MRKIWFISFLILSNHLCYAQLNDSATNRLDNNGLKQGKWRINWSYNSNTFDDSSDTLSIPGQTDYKVVINNDNKYSGYAIGSFSNGKKEGLWTYYYTSGKTKERIQYKKGSPYTVVDCFTISGDELDGGTLKEGNGLLREYYSDRIPSYECNYEKGELNGIKIDYDEKGNIHSFVHFVNGLRQGQAIEFVNPTNNKSFREMDFNNGKLSLHYSCVHVDGKVMEEMIPVNDSITKAVDYNSNGCLYSIKYFVTINKKLYYYGTWKKYDFKSGVLIEQIEYYGLNGRKEETFKMVA